MVILISTSVLAISKGIHKIKAKYKHQEPVASFNFESAQHWDGDRLLQH